MTKAIIAIGLAALTATVHADPARSEPRTLVYAELLGKGGPWGVGLERLIAPRLAIGAVASVAVLGGQQLYTLAPYAHVTVVGHGANRLFGELGATLVHSRVPSPVMSWDGTSDTGGGGIATVGWEHAGSRLVLRAYGAVEAGEGGVAPWLGIVVGVHP